MKIENLGRLFSEGSIESIFNDVNNSDGEFYDDASAIFSKLASKSISEDERNEINKILEKMGLNNLSSEEIKNRIIEAKLKQLDNIFKKKFREL